MSTKKYSPPKPMPLGEIFEIENPSRFIIELERHCFEKERNNQPLSNAEQTFAWLMRMDGRIVGDGFDSIFLQYFSPHSFARVCEALEEVGASALRELLQEAWSIYTKGNPEITLEELQVIDVRRFNTKRKMDRFDEIGEEVVSELEKQYERGRVWAVEYAKQHREEFNPIRVIG